jgi:16S rRNA (adenine1518-N6/adenine1519-N6)-dimethyltransferase
MVNLRGIKPIKRLGQVFLRKKIYLKKMIKTAEIESKDIVLEIGPGTGNLTLELAKVAKKVIAVEKDKRMCEILKEVLEKEEIKNVEILNQDILKFLKEPIRFYPFKVVANIPYYLTSRLLRQLLEIKKKPTLIVLLVQKEVAERICAKPPFSNILAVSVQVFAEPKIVSFVKKEAFFPKPKVDSAILKIVPKKETKIKDEKLFFKILRAGFFQPRKTILNNFAISFKIDKIEIEKWLNSAKIKKEMRPSQLSLKDWFSLLDTFNFSLKKLK